MGNKGGKEGGTREWRSQSLTVSQVSSVGFERITDAAPRPRSLRTLPDAEIRTGSSAGSRTTTNVTAKDTFDLLEVLKERANSKGGETRIHTAQCEFIIQSILRLQESETVDSVDREKIQIRNRFNAADVYGQEVQSYLLDEYTGATFRVSDVLEPPAVDRAVTTRVEEAMLSLELDSWEFDIFAVQETLGDDTMVVVGMELFERHNLLADDVLGVSTLVLNRYFTAVRKAYTNQPYHNSLHAADVAQTLSYIMGGTGTASLAAAVGGDLVMVALLGALVHDVGHPGVSNAFLVETLDELAVQYNDQSPLENMHLSVALQLMGAAGNDIFENMSAPRRADARSALIALVLATDNAHHARTLAALTSARDKGALNLAAGRDRVTLLALALHTADVSIAAKPWPTYRRWTELLMQEFFAQGDLERERQMEVNPMLDRLKPIPLDRFQIGFIGVIVRPLYVALSQVPGMRLEAPLQQLDQNLSRWKEIEPPEDDPRSPTATDDKAQSTVGLTRGCSQAGGNAHASGGDSNANGDQGGGGD